jgi:hypothetical protein
MKISVIAENIYDTPLNKNMNDAPRILNNTPPAELPTIPDMVCTILKTELAWISLRLSTMSGITLLTASTDHNTDDKDHPDFDKTEIGSDTHKYDKDTTYHIHDDQQPLPVTAVDDNTSERGDDDSG